MERLYDWMSAAAMWAAGFCMISAFLIFMGYVARYIAFTFCLGYGC